MIVIKSLTKTYEKNNKKIVVIDNLSEYFEEGKLYAIMGPSGSGKSTLLNIIGLLDKPSSGFFSIDNNDVCKLSSKKCDQLRLNSIGYVFQDNYLCDNLTVYENIILPLLINKKISKQKKIEITEKLLNMTSLSERSSHLPNELSGGEKQRVAIARALANDPKYILADEPTSNLDEKTEKKIFELYKKLAHDGKCIIVVSHNLLIKSYADKIIYMKKNEE